MPTTSKSLQIPPEALASAIADASSRYTAANPKSLAQHRAASEVMPGGNTRSVLFSAPFPITLTAAQGCRVTSLDGRCYVDFLGEYTAGLYGHSNPVLCQAVSKALEGGWVMGGHIRAEEELARLICERFPSIELVRFANSGTEANLYAISAAKAITAKPKVVVFEGGYHGGVFTFAGGGPGPLTAPFDFVLAPYNDIDGTRALLDTHADAIGTIVVEPMQGSGGCIPAERGFLQTLRDWASAHGALLIFDEVMTSRLSPGGLQQVHGITPDLTTLGKYIGGGFSFGAFGGRAELMRRFDPSQPGAFGHAGTFNNNVFTMAAGAAGLREVYTPAAVGPFNARGDALRKRLDAIAGGARFPMQFTGLGSMMNVHMHRGPVRSIHDVAHSVQPLRELFYFHMLEHGIWLARRGMINLSLPLGEAEFAQLEDAVASFVEHCNALA
ncbi:aspartate aminotransferase family protein [Variovorax ginsengisoli]|uniref:Aminotransferase class III-fold pyridoxal phosphate-dependent enzyme n=1 Tax=Variovorax ginsengisoli TaxID=363844 RepID=A0ABT8SCX2_9BURK|nr:aminotransferase class III-fold pyridoxal phosphate-dependent enzyme [Variovorax ginsengisoli]MDN8617475.1 aminotransferase class III-fold pyridoxal phosphate-dependent enzyme [Variovorax ginsengisoli]MDO1536645.1 aminotransferase class III-fold pyridoxal phosphate-dependent enzyme [Variovorax ginsengisoli]